MNAATVYFSVGGTTEKLAEEISLAANGAEIFKLEPQVPYTQADINWHDKQSRSSVEMDDESCRVPLADADFDFSDFDTIFVGFPICFHCGEWGCKIPVISRKHSFKYFRMPMLLPNANNIVGDRVSLKISFITVRLFLCISAHNSV